MGAGSLLGAGLASAVLVGATASAVAGAPPATLATFSQDGLTFQHPAAWRVQQFPDVSAWTPGGTRVLAYLSPRRLQDPCRPIAGGAVACTFPLMSLPRRGVLVQWSEDANRPGVGLASLGGGVRTTIGGHPARVRVLRPGGCRAVGAQETIRALIAGGPGFYDLTVCLRGPGLVRLDRMARAMLASVTISAP